MTDAQLALQFQPPEILQIVATETVHQQERPVFLMADNDFVPDKSLASVLVNDRINPDELVELGRLLPPGFSSVTQVTVLAHAESLDTSHTRALAELISHHVAIVLLHDSTDAPNARDWPLDIAGVLANDDQAGKLFFALLSAKLANAHKLISLNLESEELKDKLHGLYSSRGYEVAFNRQDSVLDLMESKQARHGVSIVEYSDSVTQTIDRLKRLDHGADTERVMTLVVGTADDSESVCALLKSGADLCGKDASDDELILRAELLFARQCDLRRARIEALRYPGSEAYNLQYLMDIGGRMYSSAQRGSITVVLAVVKLNFSSRVSSIGTNLTRGSLVAEIVKCFQRDLRDTDIFAQTDEEEFVVLVTNVGRNNLERVFDRLTTSIQHVVQQKSDGHYSVSLLVGATPELGITLESMLHRAKGCIASI